MVSTVWNKCSVGVGVRVSEMGGVHSDRCRLLRDCRCSDPSGGWAPQDLCVLSADGQVCGVACVPFCLRPIVLLSSFM